LKDPEGFRAWLLAIAHNVLIDSLRKNARSGRAETGSPQVLAAVPDSGKAPDELAQQDETRVRILALLRSLPEAYRLPLSLRYLAGADYETIGEQLGLTNGTLRGLLHRGLKMLRERMPKDLAAGFEE
jgi:RNA polymerase sigma-70 factor (ECF subfamily)